MRSERVIGTPPNSAGCPTPPRFRALALFGRRPLESVDGPVIAGIRKPAQEATFLTHRIELLTPLWARAFPICEKGIEFISGHSPSATSDRRAGLSIHSRTSIPFGELAQWRLL